MATETCPRCRSRTLVVEGYRDPVLDRFVTRAGCSGCSFRWDAEAEESSEVESASGPMAY
jgi:hypothetical protein